MKKTALVILFAVVCLVCVSNPASAKLSRYTYPYDISYIEWELLTMTTAWRDTTALADPFILENMVFNRKDKVIHVYLRGKSEQASEENLKDSIAAINARLLEKFAEFEVNSDLMVHYALTSADGKKTSGMEFSNGAFKTIAD